MKLHNMKETVTKDDVVSVVKEFCEANDGDYDTMALIIAIGGRLLDISADEMAKEAGYSEEKV